jgi:hypothetical protein
LGKDPRERTWEAFEKVFESMQSPEGEQEALLRWIQNAERKREREDYAGAIADLERALAMDVSSVWIRAEMARTYGLWASDLLAKPDLKAAAEKCTLGLQHRADDPMLLEVQRNVEIAKQFLGDEGV